MRLLLVTTDFPPDLGGTQTYAFELAIRLNDQFDRFAVVTLFVNDCDTVDSQLAFPVYRVHSSSDLFPIKARSVIARLRKHERYDSVFCVSWYAVVACLLVRLFSGPLKIFSAAHGRELIMNPVARIPLLASIYRGFRSLVIRHGVNRFFAVSRYTRNVLIQIGVADSQVHVLNNGTNPNQFFPEDASHIRARLGVGDGPVIMTIGRLVQRKGIDTMIEALPIVQDRIPGAVYVIAGSGPELDSLQRLRKALRLEHSVFFIGRVASDELRSYYNACDVFVLPAREAHEDVEGFGIVFLEAAACGKPSIGTRTGGIPDAIINGETGILVDPDAPDQLAEAVIKILGEPDLADLLGEGGLEHVRNTANWDMVAAKLAEWLKSDI